VSHLVEVEIELGRVVDRLNSMSLAKAERCADAVHQAASVILARTRDIDPSIPSAASLPRVGVSAVGSQLAVIGDDFLAAARRAPDPDVSGVYDVLVELRRSLP
jgi:hypothetical protein